MGLRVLLASAAMVAAFGPLAAHAQTAPVLDQATSTAIATWRAAALNRVDPSLKDALAAVYADKPIEASRVNAVMMAKAQAEQAAMSDLDSQSVALIGNYYAAVEAAQYASLPSFSETSDY